MKIKFLLTASLLAGASFCSMAQTHVEGMEYYKADQIANAKELLLRNLNNADTDKAIADFYLGLIAISEGNTKEAQDYFTKGTQAKPDYGYNYVGLGWLELKNGNKQAAEKFFKEGESKAKKDAAFQVAVARAYFNVDPVANAKEIEKRMEKARKIDMKEADIYLFEGDQKKAEKDFGGAGAKYEMAAEYNSDAPEAYVKYANLFSQVNPQYAIDMLNKLLKLQPQSALAQREIANAYYNAGQYVDAAKHYGNYVKSPNHFKQDEDRYAFLLFYGNDFKNGYEYATALLKENPSNFTAQRYQFMNAAQMPEMTEQCLAMAEALNNAHKANPSANKLAPIDYILMAQELNKAKRPEEAQEVLQEAIQDNPDNAVFYKELALSYVESNNLTKASDAYAEYLAHTEKPGYNDFIQQATFAFYAGVENRDNAEVAKKYYDMTLENANKAKEILPNNYKPVKFSGDVAKQTAPEGEVASAAVPAYTEAIALLEASENPKRYATDAKEMYNYMGNYYLDQKDVEKAKEYFNKYLEFDPDNAAYRKFVEGLK